MIDRPKRKPIPKQARIDACLLMLGLNPKKVEWDHEPALALRQINEDGTDYIPPQHDPRYITPREKVDHDIKTTGRKGESKNSRNGNGDQQRIAKVRKQEKRRLSEGGLAKPVDGQPPRAPTFAGS